jgi:hypothetical protein
VDQVDNPRASALGYGRSACPGCAALTCSCSPRATKAATTPETLDQARLWESVKQSYLSDGFCVACAVQAAYGHQLGFSQVAPACADCRGIAPTYRWAGPRARAWAQETALECGGEVGGVLREPRKPSSDLESRTAAGGGK